MTPTWTWHVGPSVVLKYRDLLQVFAISKFEMLAGAGMGIVYPAGRVSQGGRVAAKNRSHGFYEGSGHYAFQEYR